MSTAVDIVRGIVLTEIRATSLVVVPLLRPTVAIIVAIDIVQAPSRIPSRCWGRCFSRHRPLSCKSVFA